MIDSKQQQIIDAAKILFGEKGYNATSIRDIAELAGINVAAVNYYFGSKEELFKVIFRICSEGTKNIMVALNDQPGSVDGLKMMLRNFFKLFLHMRTEDPNGFYFINRNLDLLVEIDPETFRKNIWSLKQALSDLIKNAQKNKILKKDFDSEICSSILFSTLGHLLRDEHIACKFSENSVFDDVYRNKYINNVVNFFIDGAKETT